MPRKFPTSFSVFEYFLEWSKAAENELQAEQTEKVRSAQPESVRVEEPGLLSSSSSSSTS
jgi:hypothetical protein